MVISDLFTPYALSALSVQDYAVIEPPNLFVHWAKKSLKPALVATHQYMTRTFLISKLQLVQ